MLGNKSPKLVLDDRRTRTIRGRISGFRMAVFTIMTALLLLSAFPVSAQEPTRTITDDEVNAIAKELFCPICENTPLDVCETQACADWRQVIREKLAGGQSDEQIKDYFADQYGVRALAEPPAEGVTLLVWLVPIIAIPSAIILFGLYLRNIRGSAARSTGSTAVVSRPATTEPDEPDPEQDPYAARIERELRDM
ncbi:MAG: cytochrome c-type biogenesis protein CcmH [Candidatus Promineifilaceae bacterium]